MPHIIIVAAFVALCALPAWSGDTPKRDPGRNFNLERAITNALIGLNCSNDGVRDCSMWLLGELRADKAVVPLMCALHNGTRERCRTIAALALCRIGDRRGTYAVRRAALYDQSDKVRLACAWFYTTYVDSGTFRMPAAAERVVASLLTEGKDLQ